MTEFILDTRTVLFSASMGMLIAALALFLLYWLHKEVGGIIEWAIAYLIIGIIFILFGLRGVIPDEFSILLTNGCILFSLILIYRGCCKFVNRKPRTILLYGIMALFWGPFFFIYQSPDYFSLRTILISLGIASLFLLSSHILFVNSNRSKVAHKIVASLFLMIGLIHLVTASWYIIAPAIKTDLWFGNTYIGPIRSWHLLVSNGINVAGMVFCAMGYIIMITERLRNTLKERVVELAISRDLAETSLKEQRNFYTMISHEFKTPLSVINGANEIISMNLPDTDDESREEVDRIHRSTTKLTKIIDSLLMEDWLENSVQDQKHNPVSLHSILETVSSEHQIPFYSKPQKEVLIKGDSRMLPILFSNLMDNAAKYGRNSDAVSINYYQNEYNEAIVEVIDDGPGIDQAEKELIFEKFYRSERAHNKQGGGLGLFLVKQILNLHNARIENEKTANRNIFRVIFPLNEKALS